MPQILSTWFVHSPFSKFPPLIWLHHILSHFDTIRIKGGKFENVTKYDATLIQNYALSNSDVSISDTDV